MSIILHLETASCYLESRLQTKNQVHNVDDNFACELDDFISHDSRTNDFDAMFRWWRFLVLYTRKNYGICGPKLTLGLLWETLRLCTQQSFPLFGPTSESPQTYVSIRNAFCLLKRARDIVFFLKKHKSRNGVIPIELSSLCLTLTTPYENHVMCVVEWLFLLRTWHRCLVKESSFICPSWNDELNRKIHQCDDMKQQENETPQIKKCKIMPQLIHDPSVDLDVQTQIDTFFATNQPTALCRFKHPFNTTSTDVYSGSGRLTKTQMRLPQIVDRIRMLISDLYLNVRKRESIESDQQFCLVMRVDSSTNQLITYSIMKVNELDLELSEHMQ